MMSSPRPPARRHGTPLGSILTCILLELAACTPTPSKWNQAPQYADWQTRWLDAIPCQPPCWEGITPGRTSGAEAVNLLRRSPLVRASTVTSGAPLPYGRIEWRWTDGAWGGMILYSAEAVTTPVETIFPSLPLFRLGDVIRRYGEPNSVRAFIYPTPDGPRYHSVTLFYLSKGILLNRETEDQFDLTEDLLLEVAFFAPSNEGLAAATGRHLDFLDTGVPWEGYRGFDQYCRQWGSLPCP